MPQYLLLAVSLLTAAQFIPLCFNLHLSGTPVEVALRSLEAKISAGFGLGALSIIFGDLLLDAFVRKYNLWISRSFYFWIACFYSIFVICFSDIKNSGSVYICYLNASLVFLVGRAMVDISMLDTSNTWTYAKSMGLSVFLAVSLLIFTLSLNNDFSGFKVLCLVGLCALYLFIAAFATQCGYMIFRILRKYPTPDWRTKLSLISNEDTTILIMVMTILTCIVAITVIVPSVSLGGSFSDRNGTYVSADLIIRLFFATSLEIIPSLFLRLKSDYLRRDLEVKRLFVRYVGHEIRTPLNISISKTPYIALCWYQLMCMHRWARYPEANHR
jgi:hypothetical protein